MKVSSRAALAWANKGMDAAAPIIIADWLRETNSRGVVFDDDYSLADAANEVDPR
jgi:hypothetical protein